VVIVDSSIWVDYLRGADTPQTHWLNDRADQQRLGLTDLILCEVLQGMPDDSYAARVEEQLSKLVIFQTGGRRLAIASAQNYRILRTHSRTVRKTLDCLIATFCLMNDHSLLHNDRDYDAFEKYLDLKVIHP
jgi:hypothetical protein